MVTDDLPPTIDPVAAARWAQLTAPTAAAPVSPWLHEEVARRMEERLGWIRQRPRRWAHWEGVRGGLEAHALLARRYPDAVCFLVESSAARLAQAREHLTRPWWTPGRWLGPAMHFGAPPEAGVDMVWANMSLHQTADPRALMARWYRALAADGFVMFSCLGPDTLRELRSLYRALGWPPPAHEFTDMHDWGDMLMHAGFAEPVMDMERITLSFESPARLLRELRELGRNLHPERFAGLRGRGWLGALHQGLARHLVRADEGGRLGLSFEVIYGHAFKPQPRMPRQAETQVSLEEMRVALRQRKNKTNDL